MIELKTLEIETFRFIDITLFLPLDLPDDRQY